MEKAENTILGKWQQMKGQPFEGLWFEFFEDGSFKAAYPEMGVTSSGKYSYSGDLINLNQTQHTLGLVGVFEGRFKIESNVLRLSLSDAGEKAPENLSKARNYIKQ
mgnify:CR=1 FL=1